MCWRTQELHHENKDRTTRGWHNNATKLNSSSISLFLQGDLSSDNLYQLADSRLSKARADLRAPRTRMKEFGDYHFLQNWLMKSVRGIANNRL